MPKLTPQRARKVLQQLGLDPSEFVRQASNARGAKFIIDNRIRELNRLYHPDTGIKTSEDFQKWGETLEDIKRVSTLDIFMAVKNGKRGNHAARRAIEKVEEVAANQERVFASRFAFGNHQRELEDNLADRVVILSEPHPAFANKSTLDLQTIGGISWFKGALKQKQDKFRKKVAEQEEKRLSAREEQVKKRIGNLDAKISEARNYIRTIKTLQDSIGRTSSAHETWGVLKEFYGTQLEHIVEEGAGKLHEKYLSSYAAAGPRRAKTDKSRKKERDETISRYVTSLEKQAARIETTQQRDRISLLAQAIINAAETGKTLKEHGKRKKSILTDRVYVGRKADMNVIGQMELTTRAMVDELEKAKERHRKDTTFPGSKANDALLKYISRPLAREYKLSRRMIRAFFSNKDYLATLNDVGRRLALMDESRYEHALGALTSSLAEQIELAEKEIGYSRIQRVSAKEEEKQVEKQKELFAKGKAEKQKIPAKAYRKLVREFLDEGPEHTRRIYGPIGTTRTSIGPHTIAYIGPDMRLSFYNFDPAKKQPPTKRNFTQTNRRVVGVVDLKKVKLVEEADNEQLQLTGEGIQSIRGRVYDQNYMLDRGWQNHLLTSPVQTAGLLTVESKKGHDLYRIEGIIKQTDIKSLADISGSD